jgi:large subunit ribosomal protein L6
LPAGAKVNIKPGVLEVKGPKGELNCPIPRGVEFKLEETGLVARRSRDEDAAVHGLARALASNAVAGVTEGFTKQLEIVGIGYRAQAAGKVVIFSLGYSHPIEFLMPKGIDIKVDAQTKLTVTGIDRQLVGQTAANIRSLRPPEPYKNKGIRYAGEQLRKKEGKTGAIHAMYNQPSIHERRLQIHKRIRRSVKGSAQRPRLAVHRSLKHIYGQIIDDATGRTLVSASTAEKSAKVKNGGNVAAAKAVGQTVAKRALEQGIKAVVFDRGGHRYHGRVRALADAAREAGLQL